MSFQDVGRGGGRSTRPPPQRRGPQQGYSTTGGAFSSAAAAAGNNSNGRSPPRSGNSNNNNTNTTTSSAASGYDHISDSILQYQKNVALLERMSHKAEEINTNPVLQTQYTLQIDVITQLGSRIESQLAMADKRLATLSRAEAAGCRTTHVKLNRDYRMVEQTFKNVQLDVRKKRSLAEARVRERRMEEERRALEKTRGNSIAANGGGFVDLSGAGSSAMGGGDLSEEGMRWQMKIQEDVSCCYISLLFIVYLISSRFIKNIHPHIPYLNILNNMYIYCIISHTIENQRRNHA